MADSEIKIDKSVAVIMLLLGGALLMLCGVAGHMILVRLEWLGWEGVVMALTIVICGICLTILGWKWLQVLRE